MEHQSSSNKETDKRKAEVNDAGEAVPIQESQAGVGKAQKKISPIETRLSELALALKPLAAAERLWKHFTAKEKESLGGNLPDAYWHEPGMPNRGTVGMYVRVTGCSPAAAIIECAYRINLISLEDASVLSREFAEWKGEDEASSQMREAFLEADKQIATDDESLIRHRRMSCMLVLVVRGNSLEISWNHDRLHKQLKAKNASAQFLLLLAKQRKKGLRLTNQWLKEQNLTMSLKDAKLRLRGQIPDDLFARIESTAKGEYWLALDANEIETIEI